MLEKIWKKKDVEFSLWAAAHSYLVEKLKKEKYFKTVD